MKKSLITFLTVLAVVLLVAGATGCTKLRARDQLNRGVAAYKNAEYPEAVRYFNDALSLDPEFHTARLYLATAYMSQYIPGAASPENVKMADMAENEFLTVLKAVPNDTVAIASIASLHFHKKEFDQSEEWYRKLISVDPKNKEAYYTLGVIAWTRTFQTRMMARAELGMRPEDPGPLKDEKVRAKIREVNLPLIESGLDALNKAIQIDPEYDDAMAYLNLLYREEADLANSQEEYDRDISTADNWVDKTLETKKLKAAREQKEEFGLTE
jgi:tetratricopeptide (TPR) repeat protein